MLMSVARATGWSEEKILWEVPLVRLVQYVHSQWAYDGAVCHWCCFNGVDGGGVAGALERARAQWMDGVNSEELDA